MFYLVQCYRMVCFRFRLKNDELVKVSSYLYNMVISTSSSSSTASGTFSEIISSVFDLTSPSSLSSSVVVIDTIVDFFFFFALFSVVPVTLTFSCLATRGLVTFALGAGFGSSFKANSCFFCLYFFRRTFLCKAMYLNIVSF